jgi:transposase-like protein
VPITPTNPLKGRQYPGEVIVTVVHWYLRYPLAYEQIAELLAEQGLVVDASGSGSYAPSAHRRR